MTNREIARVFLRIAELMSYREESTFKVRAYYRAALQLSALQEPLSEIVARQGLTSLEGVGEAISSKIQEILHTGTCGLYERLKAETPEHVQELLRSPGLTPRLVRLLEHEFHVDGTAAFVQLARSGGLASLEDRAIKVEDAGQMLRAAEAMGMFVEEPLVRNEA